MQHFAHARCNELLSPADGDEKDVSPLPVHLHREGGCRAITSFWRPSEQDIANILAGGCVALTVLGVNPPVRLEVLP